MARPGQRQRGMNLVGDDRNVIAIGEFRDRLQLLASEDASCGIVGITEEIGLGAASERLLEAT